MKRKYANRVKGDYFSKEIDNDYFKGVATFIYLRDIKSPKVVNNGLYDYTIIDNDYKWIGLYPESNNYTITIMIDDKGKTIQWYFDMVKNIGFENDVPYADDLYLDLIISKEGNKIIDDEDELLEARKLGEITDLDVQNAYDTLKYLEEKYYNDLDSLKLFTEWLKKEFKK